MSNSNLVDYIKLSPCNSGARTHSIDRITPHCVVGQASVEGLGSLFSDVSRQVSCNYGIGADGRVGMYVAEKNRSWCSSSNANDQRAVTIECASDATAPYAFKDVVYQKLITLCVDICKRNGKKKLLWFADKNKTLNYTPKSDEMVLTVHRWFANKSCPGDWMYARMGTLAKRVTEQLEGGKLVWNGKEWAYQFGGKTDTSFTGLAKNANGTWYVKNGVVDFTYNGTVTNKDGTWNVVKGKVTSQVKAMPVLKKGSKSEDVKTLQKKLNAKGYKLTVDGIFGDKTLSAVKDFQKKNGLAVDGIVGKNTWAKLG